MAAVIANPLRLTGLGLPPQVVLLCRVLAVAVLFTNHQALLQTPFLPFLDVFLIPPPDGVLLALRVLLVAGCLGVLFTNRVRLFAVCAAAGLLGGVLSARTYYGNNKTFAGLLFLLAALSAEKGPPRLIQWQLALVYFGAGFNKLLDPDWRSGLFFDHWAAVRLENPAYQWLAAQLPPLLAGKLFCWYTIVAEIGLAAFMLRPTRPAWILWGSGLFQCGLLLFTGSPFTLFFFAMQAALLAFAPWPDSPVIVIWDGSCGLCRRTRDFVSRLDFDPVFDWRPLQSGIGDRFGLSAERLRQAMHAAGDGWLLSGYAAFRRMALHLPLFWILLTAAVALAPGALERRLLVGAALFFLLPLSNPFGDAAYSWVARRRHELLPGETCELPEKS